MLIVCAAFFARVKPVSTIANPACMNMTREPASSVHTKLIAILLWPTVSITSEIVGFFASLTVTSFAVPVTAPVGSPCPIAPCAYAVDEPAARLSTHVSNATTSAFPNNFVCRLMFPVLFVTESIYLGTRVPGTRRAVRRGDVLMHLENRSRRQLSWSAVNRADDY